MSGGTGHPLPNSDEARHGEVPEGLEDEKGRGDDAAAIVSPDPAGANPDGTHYSYDDLGRGPGTQEPRRSD